MTVRSVVGALLLAVVIAGGCVRAPDRLDPCVTQASTSRPAAAASLLAGFKAGELTFNECLDRAHDLLDQGDPRAPAFAGAVLDLGASIEGELPSGGEFEIFWFRIGRLACKSAAAASQAGRLREAESLVLAGPKRWQVEAYWLRYPDHDGLASMILHANGRTAEALSRLSERSVLRDEAEEAYELIRKGRK
jgi:hypothetical protein